MKIKCLRVHFGTGGDDIQVVRQNTRSDAFLIYAASNPTDKPLPKTVIVAEREDKRAIRNAMSDIMFQIGIDDLDRFDATIEGDSPEHKNEASDLNMEAHQIMTQIKSAKSSGLISLRSMLANIPRVCEEGFWKPGTRFDGRSAIICGAGPSLEKALPVLREVQNRIPIICVGRVFEYLTDHGVTPWMVVEIDPFSHVNWMKNQDGRSIEVPLLASICVSPKVVDKFRNILWVVDKGDADGVLNWAGIKLPELTMNGSTSIAAINAALTLFGFSTVGLVGVDLCYSADSDHVGKTGIDDNSPVQWKRAGRDGETVTSNPILSNQIAFIESIAMKNPFKIFNCSEGGAYIAGTVDMSLDSFSFLDNSQSLPLPVEAFGLHRDKVPVDHALAALEDFVNAAVGMHVQWLTQEGAEEDIDKLKKTAGELVSCLSKEVSLRVKDVTSFHTFKGQALDFIDRSNKNLCRMLFKGFPDRCDYRMLPNGMDLPYLEIDGPHDEKVRMTSRISNEGMVKDWLRKILNELQFDPFKTVVCFETVGDWSYAVQFAKWFPQAKTIIIDHRPDILEQIISRCQFIHFLPEDAIVIGAVAGLNYKTRYIEAIEEFQRQGLRDFKLLQHPKLAEVIPVAELALF